MARTLRRKGRNTEGHVKSKGTTAAVTRLGDSTGDTALPQIQELQNVMDLERDKTQKLKIDYMTQNAELARANSSLMVRFSELEKRLSELVQENVSLRSKLSITELQYKNKLQNQLEILEEGISHRFEEINHMFERIRNKEGLPSRFEIRKLNSGTSFLAASADEKQSSLSPRVSSHIQFLQPTNEKKDERNPQLVITDDLNGIDIDDSAAASIKLKRKRRKSSRRDSIILPPDFQFYNEEDKQDEKETTKERENLAINDNLTAFEGINSQNSGLEEINAALEYEKTSETTSNNTITDSNKKIDKQVEYKNSDNSKDNNMEDLPADESNDDVTFNYTNPIVDYSIPEETMESIINNDTKNQSSSKIDVFRDDQDKPHLIHALPSSADCDNKDSNDNQTIYTANDTNELKKLSFVPILEQNKVKHSMGPTNTRSVKKIVDEVMPGAGSPGVDLRTRRTRGKAINYTLPSLRAKMRRPTEKLVDATTIISIHDLQVNKRTKRLKTNQLSEKANFNTQSKENGSAVELDLPKPIVNSKDTLRLAENKDHIEKENSMCMSPEKRKTSSLKPILRDITNRPNTKPIKTRKLYKNAIISDSNDNEDATIQNDGVRFASDISRPHEEELSVFDLIGSDNIKPAHKTYRAKSKKQA